MFKKARLKLTAWYLLIIMAISLSFSIFIYKVVTAEFRRRLMVIERRYDFPDRNFRPGIDQIQIFVKDLEEARIRVLLILIYTNTVIFLLSSAAGYFLAGKTLAPIEEVLIVQKRFVADASHELRTPLTALKTATEVTLRDKKITLTQALKTIKSNLDEISSLQSLTDNLLQLTAYQGNGQSLNFEQVNIGDVIAKVCRKLSPLAKKKQIMMKAETGTHYIQANKESIEQLMLIFLDNGVKFTPKKGNIEIKTKVEGKSIIITIKDTGIGIIGKDIQHIFDRFYRVDQSRSKVIVPGFGLGLSLAKKIVDIHNGKIEVSSQPGKGSVFTVRLPLNHS